jgi:glycosyltransferase involved in cell wall biosynthesis
MEDTNASGPGRPVVLLAHHLEGTSGVTRSVSNLANGLAAAGLDVHVLALLRRGHPRYRLDPRVEITYVRSLRPKSLARLGEGPRERDAEPSRLCESGTGMSALTDLRLERHLGRLGPCTLVSHRPSLHQAAAMWAPDHVARLAVEHSSFDVREEAHVRAITEALPSLDRLVLLTEDDRRRWREHLGSDEKLAVVPNATPLEAGGPRTSWHAPVILAAGHLNRRKGFHHLVRAFAPLTHEFPQWRLRICGRGPEEAALSRLIEDEGVGAAVELAGFTRSLDREMHAASVFAMSSSSEGLPMVLLEALATGMPVAAFDCTGVRELVHDGETGLLVPQGDVAALTDALRRLMADESLRRRFGQASRAEVRGYGPESVTAQWLDLIEQVSPASVR